MRLKNKLLKWQNANLITAEQSAAIIEFESQSTLPQFLRGTTGIGVLAILLGVLSLVAANWQYLGGATKILLHLCLNGAVAAAIWSLPPARQNWREALLLGLFGLTLTFIALLGQVFQTQAPDWQPLGLWLLMTSPMLFIWARWQLTVTAWLCSLLFFVFVVLFELDPPIIVLQSLPLLLFILLLPASISRLAAWPVWPQTIRNLSLALTAALVTMAQSAWSVDSNQLYQDMVQMQKNYFPREMFFIACAGLLVWALMVRQRLLNDPEHRLTQFVLLSIGLGFMPLLLPHGEWALASMLGFIVYWLYLGWVGATLHLRWLFNLAFWFIALRLCVGYLELFGSLLQTGFGLIVTGIALLLLGTVLKRLQKFLGQKLWQQ